MVLPISLFEVTTLIIFKSFKKLDYVKVFQESMHIVVSFTCILEKREIHDTVINDKKKNVDAFVALGNLNLS